MITKHAKERIEERLGPFSRTGLVHFQNQIEEKARKKDFIIVQYNEDKDNWLVEVEIFKKFLMVVDYEDDGRPVIVTVFMDEEVKQKPIVHKDKKRFVPKYRDRGPKPKYRESEELEVYVN